MHEQVITTSFLNNNPETWSENPELMQSVLSAIDALDQGHMRIASLINNEWKVNSWLKQAILIYLRTQVETEIQLGDLLGFDKIPLKYNQENIKNSNARIVPPATVRYGAYIGEKVVLMPSYINIGAYVGDGSMIDTWATIGSCAQIGENVHISGGVGIGGVLEPLQASPTIIEDNCFIGARSEIVEGVIVRRGAVVSMGVMLTKSTKIFDRVNNCFHYGEIPEYAVVVPGSLPSECGRYSLAAAIIVKYVDAKTRAKTSINELLR